MLKCRFAKFFLVVLFLFVTGNVFALTWDELKAKIEEKYEEFNSEIKDMQMVMQVESKGMPGQGPAESKMFVKGEKYRMESKMNMPEGSGMPAGMKEMKSIIIFDGKDTWAINPFTGKKKLPAQEGARSNQMVWWEDLPANGKIIGTEKVGEKDCYVVQTWDEEEDSKLKGWIDKENLTLVRLKYENEEGKTFTVVNSDFENLEDWQMPYTTKVLAGGEEVSKTVIKSIEINKGLSDDLFDPDKVSEGSKGTPGMPGMPGMNDMMEKFKPGQ